MQRLKLIHLIVVLIVVTLAEGASRSSGTLKGVARRSTMQRFCDMISCKRVNNGEVSVPVPLPAGVIPSLMTDTKNILNFLHIVEKLKLEKRTGWHRCGIPFIKTESIADHMYRMAIMAITIQDNSIDKLKAVKMALVHDMAEALVGDITPDCGVSEEEKYRREAEAMQTIRETLGDNPFGVEAQELWVEYAADSTKESHFVKDIDKTELIVQVVEYEKIYNINFQKWLTSALPKIRHEALKAIAYEALLERPKEFLAIQDSQEEAKAAEPVEAVEAVVIVETTPIKNTF